MKQYFLVSACLCVFLSQNILAEPTGRIFITNEKGNTVSVINGETLEVESEIAIGERPRGIGISPDGTEVYVAVSEENLIAVFDPKTLKVLRKFESGSDPETFAVHPNGNIYISNEDDAKATVYNPRTGDLIAEIQ
ncbi:MAG: PQQ-dependent catabolism-associated beta-propeller protein, partial [Gammaproteobacteria bacterium]